MAVDGFIDKKYQYSVFLGVGVVVVALLLTFLAVKPLFSTSTKLTADAKQKQETLDALKAKKATLDKLSQRADEIKAEEEKVSNALPKDEEVGRLFIELDQLIASAGGKSSSVSSGGQTALVGTGNVNTTSYTIPADFPNYFSFKDALSKTQKALRLLNVSDISANASSDGHIGINLNTVTYTRK